MKPKHTPPSGPAPVKPYVYLRFGCAVDTVPKPCPDPKCPQRFHDALTMTPEVELFRVSEDGTLRSVRTFRASADLLMSALHLCPPETAINAMCELMTRTALNAMNDALRSVVGEDEQRFIPIQQCIRRYKAHAPTRQK